jgi:uncharacterized protein (DUF952 family)
MVHFHIIQIDLFDLVMQFAVGLSMPYYQNQSDLIKLHIDENKLTAPLKYELAPSVNEEFPHIYGKLNLDAVVNTEAL